MTAFTLMANPGSINTGYTSYQYNQAAPFGYAISEPAAAFALPQSTASVAPWSNSTINMYNTQQAYNGQLYNSPLAQGYMNQNNAYNLTPATMPATGSPGIFSQATDWVNQNLGGWGNAAKLAGSAFNIYGGMQQMGLAKDQLALAKDTFNFNKGLALTNLDNSIKNYNTSLEDRMRARAHMETGNQNAYNQQIEERKLKSRGV